MSESMMIKTTVPCPSCGVPLCNLCAFNGMCQDCKTELPKSAHDAVVRALHPEMSDEEFAVMMEDDEEGFPEEGFFGVKWCADDCETLSAVADRLEALAKWIRALEASGAQLTQPVDNGHASYLPNIEPTDEALRQFNFEGFMFPEEAAE